MPQNAIAGGKKFCKLGVHKVKSYVELRVMLERMKLQDSIIVCVGAGNISDWAHKLVKSEESIEYLSERRNKTVIEL